MTPHPKQLLLTLAAVLLLAPIGARAQAPSAAALIEDTVHVLPADLRAGATVVTYDAATGARQGAHIMIPINK